jgi:Rho termination factor, N-terminal domain
MSKEQPGNQTPNTPDVSETELRSLKVDELRERARAEGVESVADLRKEELVGAISKAHASGGSSGSGSGGAGAAGDAGPDGGHVRTGDQTSKSVKYSQEVTSPDDDPERPGRSLVTTSHEVIRQWAEERGGRPATVDGTEHGGRAGVLRIDFQEPTDRLREISWDEWFEVFDSRGLNFIYQEERSDGHQSTFFRLENPA